MYPYASAYGAPYGTPYGAPAAPYSAAYPASFAPARPQPYPAAYPAPAFAPAPAVAPLRPVASTVLPQQQLFSSPSFLQPYAAAPMAAQPFGFSPFGTVVSASTPVVAAATSAAAPKKTVDEKTVRAKYAKAGQEQVFAFWDKLSAAERQTLLEDLDEIDLDDVAKIYKSSQQQAAGIKPEELKPFPDTVKSTDASDAERAEWSKLGLNALANGKVAIVLMAGGQATRLGSSFPKGMLSVKLPSDKSLFQLQAERLVKLRELASKSIGKKDCSIPLYVMTSPGQAQLVTDYYKKNNYFGLNPADVKFFNQCTLPCVTPEGKIILENKCKVARSPDGHGGLYKGLGVNGVHTDIAKRGIDFVYTYCVDNILIKMGDPLYIGYCIAKKVHFGYKVVNKGYPEEPAGVVCIRNGVTDYVEYSELPKEVSVIRADNGDLAFNAANILNLFYTREFVTRVITEGETMMPYHVAKKKIPFADPKTGDKTTPEANNGWKFEKFVLDCTTQAKNNVAVFMVPREEEFSPIKNGWGKEKDSPDTALQHIVRYHKTLVRRAGGKISDKDFNDDSKLCEISPLLSYDGEGEELAKMVRGKKLSFPLYLKSSKE